MLALAVMLLTIFTFRFFTTTAGATTTTTASGTIAAVIHTGGTGHDHSVFVGLVPLHEGAEGTDVTDKADGQHNTDDQGDSGLAR